MNVLIIDDHPSYSEGLAALLQPHFPDFHFFCQPCPLTALQLLTQTDSQVDLVLLDLVMPGMSGLSWVQTLIERNIQVATVILSGADDPAIIQQLLKLGCSGYIPKHYTTAQIVTAIKQCCLGHIYLPEKIGLQLHELEHKAQQREQVIQSRQLTRRELEVLTLLEAGLSNDEISEQLSRSLATVKTHINRLYSKLSDPQLRVSCRKDCLYQAYMLGLFYAPTEH